MPTLRHPFLTLLLLFIATTFLYFGGLNGPFLFDDYIHITQNQWVKIDSLSWPHLVQAWGSSFSPFPTNRPLAQLSFGVNHALSGLDPWAFKTTNLAIHLLSGLFVYLLVHLVFRALNRERGDATTAQIMALTTAALWLVHPLHVSTVLYTVQRMAQLSTLSLLAALSCYFWGRIQIANGRPGALWILSSAPIAVLGFLGKENTALLPLLLLVSEMTVLRSLPTARRAMFMRVIWVLFIALPLLLALIHVAMNPSYLNYDGRPFGLEERVLTQTRVLWLYLQWLLEPDISAFGMFHDDIPVSTGLTDPPTTILAVFALTGLAGAAIVLRKKAPIFSFAALFFLAGHALESSVFPLEMVFEHRNYLPSVGPLLLLVYIVTVASARIRARWIALTLGALLLVSFSVVTYLRVDNWSSYRSFIFSSATNHPESPRSNFMAGQMLISAVSKSEGDVAELADAARLFLNNGIAADPRCINCIFGLIVLDLYLDLQPPPALVSHLAEALRSGYVGATKVSISQFSFLVKWQRSDGSKLPNEALELIFDSALANPRWRRTGRAGIETAYRGYWEEVVQDLPRALKHAEAAVESWPEQWSYHMNVVKLLKKIGRVEEALTAADRAAERADNQAKVLQTAQARAEIERDLQK